MKYFKYGIIISIILTILLLIILIINSKDSFKNDIKNVYISMTTIPERLKNAWFYNNLKKNMSSLKHNYIIIINIPKYSLNQEKYIIPDNVIKLQQDNSDKLIFNRVNKDEGPITKLLPTLRNDNIKDSDIVIICDDDIYYKPKVFELIEKGVNSYPNKISSMCGENIFQGYVGVGFKKKILKNILKFNYPKSCIKVDDEIIDFYIKKNNIKFHHVFMDGKKKNNIFCSIVLDDDDRKKPNWYKLKNDNRSEHTLNCINDLNKIL